MKNKILKSLITISIVAPSTTVLVPLSSCNSTSKQKDVEGKVALKSNVKANELGDYNEDTCIPMYVRNNSNKDIRINAGWNAASVETVRNIWYRIALDSGEWSKPIKCTGEPFDLYPKQTIQFYAYSYNTYVEKTYPVAPCDKDICLNIQIGNDPTVVLGNNDVTIGGTMLSLYMAESPVDETTGEVIEDAKAHNWTGTYSHNNIFANSWALTNVSSNLLTSLDLPNHQYSDHCFYKMFYNCPNLRQAPLLPWGFHDYKDPVLREGCYESMFEDCTSLTTAPELPSLILAQDCYKNMFKGCTNLRNIHIGYVGNFVDKYFSGWVDGVKSVGTLYYSGIDTERSSRAIPTNFNVVSDSYVTSHEKYRIINFKADANSSKIIGKTKFATLFSSCWEHFHADMYKDYITFEPTKDYTNSDFDGFYVQETGVKYENLEDSIKFPSTRLSIQELTGDNREITIVPKYGWDPTPYIQAGYINAIFYREGTIYNDVYGLEGSIEYQIINKDNPSPVDTGWKTVPYSSSSEPKSVPAHSVVIFRNYLTTINGVDYGPTQSYNKWQSLQLKLTDKTNVGQGICLKGNLNSLLLDKSTGKIPDKYKLALPNDYCFYALFYGSDIVSIDESDENLLPYTTVKSGAYSYMFSNNELLVNSPKLPAKTVNNGVISYSEKTKHETTYYYTGTYMCMFENCKSLKKVGKISANALTSIPSGGSGGSFVFTNMFYGCSSLKVYNYEVSGSTLFWTLPTDNTSKNGITASNHATDDMLTGTVGYYQGSKKSTYSNYVPASTKLYYKAD